MKDCITDMCNFLLSCVELQGTWIMTNRQRTRHESGTQRILGKFKISICAHLATTPQVVRWRRKFPFNFLTDREYVIARQLFTAGGGKQSGSGYSGRAAAAGTGPPSGGTPYLYGITKSVGHPGADRTGKTIKVERFYSMWRCRWVDFNFFDFIFFKSTGMGFVCVTGQRSFRDVYLIV